MPGHREWDECGLLSMKWEFTLAACFSHHRGCGTGRMVAGTSPSENHISCLTDNVGQENAKDDS